MENMITEQIKLEKEMTAVAVSTYNINNINQKQHGSFSSTKSAQAFIKAVLAPFTGVIQKYLAEYNEGKATRKTKAAHFLEQLSPDITAYITLRTVLNLVYRQEQLPIQAYYKAIGIALEDEIKMASVKKVNKAYYKSIQQDLNSRNANGKRKKAVTLGVFNKHLNYRCASSPLTYKIYAGMILLHLLADTTGYITIKHVKSKNKHFKTLEPTKALEDFILKADKFYEVMFPFYLPMVVTPKPWVNIFDGGYLSPYLRRNMLIKTKIPSKKDYYIKLNETIPDKVYSAVNILQSTPWTINKKVLEVLSSLWDRGEAVGGLPNREDETFYPFPYPEHVKGSPYLTEELAKVKEWKLATYITHKHNIAMRSSRIRIQTLINIAEKFKKYEAIWFPHQLDFRGRLYPIPVLLNPQGDDMSKGLLQFKEGKILDENSVKWLEIHGANCFGYDKVSYQERIKFIRQHKEDVVNVAYDPYRYRMWLDADKPFQFLAFCFEYAVYLKYPHNFVTHLPVRLDGTCNGLQHYSALLRDKTGAKAVNLLNSSSPSDIYRTVADNLTAALKQTADITAKKWLALGINRKLTKRPVMVLPYGGTLLSCRQYIQEYLTDNYSLDFIQKHFKLADDPRETLFKAAYYLSGFLWEAIKNTVKSAIIGMDYLKQLVRIHNKYSPYIEWITPMGLLIRQQYMNSKTSTLKTELYGNILYANIAENSNTTDKTKQINGICPNYIHSLDSSCLMLYLLKASKEGISSFTSVHDCYGTLAPDTELSAKLLREAFVEIYKKPLLDDIEYDLVGELPDIEKPEKPCLGDLDINNVLTSEYFFN